MIHGKSADEGAKGVALVEVNGCDYALTGYVGAVPLRGYYFEGNEKNDNREPQGFLVDQP